MWTAAFSAFFLSLQFMSLEIVCNVDVEFYSIS